MKKIKKFLKYFIKINAILFIVFYFLIFSLSARAADDANCIAKGSDWSCVDTTLVSTAQCEPTSSGGVRFCDAPQYDDIKYRCCKGVTATANTGAGCGLKYPDDGQCIDSCSASQFEDSESGLCPTDKKCCHTYGEQLNYKLQVPIFQTAEVKSFADYIANIYNYSFYVLVPIVIVIIIWAGFKWILAGGDITKIQEAKKYISGAVVGLIIAVLSYTILSLYGITNVGSLQVQYIGADDEYFIGAESYAANVENSGLMGETNPAVPGVNTATGVPVYRQGDGSPWARKPYGGCGTYGSSACGATSFAMVLSFYGVKKDPYQAGEGILVPCKCRFCGKGTDGNCFTNSKPCALNKVGFKGVQITQSKVINYLAAGKPLIASVGAPNCKFTKHRHYIVLAGLSGGKIIVHDPNAKHPSPWPSTPREIFGCAAPRFYYIAPADKYSPL